MQLDNIAETVRLIMALLGAALFTAALGMWIFYEDDDRIFNRLERLIKKLVWPFVISLLLATFLPSSRTLAAMLILPKLANSLTIQKEAGELYQMAKQGLRDVLKKKISNDIKYSVWETGRYAGRS